LVGVLRCASEKALGLCSASQKASGIFGSIEAVKEKVSETSANPFNSGQLLATPQSEGVVVLPTEQYSSDLDTDKCFMAQSYRMSIHAC